MKTIIICIAINQPLTHLNWRHRHRVWPVVFHHCPHRILQYLKDNVIQMRWHIHDAHRRTGIQIVVLRQLQFGTSHIVLVAQKARVLKGILHYGARITHGIDAANVASVTRNVTEEDSYLITKAIFQYIGCWQCAINVITVLIDQHTNANPRHVESVEKVLN